MRGRSFYGPKLDFHLKGFHWKDMAMRNDSAGFPVSGAPETRKVRVEIDSSAEKLGYKIRQARMEKVPYIVIVGGKETNHKSISERRRC